MELTDEMLDAIENVRDQFQENREFSEGFAMMASQGHELSQTQEISENYVRNLGDIVRSTPQNAAEMELLTKAQITLSPSEFQECVNNNATPEQVQQVVNQTEIVQEVAELALNENYQEQQRELEAAQEVADREVEKDPLQLGDEFGVMSEIAKALSEANLVEGKEGEEISAPTTPAVERDEGPGIDR